MGNRVVKILQFSCVAFSTFFILFEFTDVELRIKTFKHNYGLLKDGGYREGSRTVISVKQKYRSFGEYENDEFVKDHIPNTSEKLSFHETIHICTTVGGARAALESRFLLRSLYVHAWRSNLYFHFLVTSDAKQILQRYLSEFSSPAVNISYEFIKFDAELVKRRAKSVKERVTHFSEVFGMSKSFMYEMLSDVEKCMILDTDLIFGTDPAFLWARFNDLEPSYFGRLKLGKNQNDTYSGVMLQRFSKMRNSNFDLFYGTAVANICKPLKGTIDEFNCKFGDKSLIYVAQLRSPLFKDLENSWALELCRDFMGHSLRSWRENDQLFFGIVHFNCLQARGNVESIEDYMMKYQNSELGRYLLFLDKLNDTSTKFR